ncbi:MAG: hypothetical protein HYV09_10110 [Deltaproteobacteria bacterium]|nr:hypothetical protein [Deltaproteobacteria bacterium]
MSAALALSCRRRDDGPPVGITDPSIPIVPPPDTAVTGDTGDTRDTGDARDASDVAVAEAPYPKAAPRELIAGGALSLHDWALPGDAKLARRAVVLVPTHLAKGERVPLLIALHGLAETVDEELGAYAWVKKYGIGDGYAHARAPDTITVAGLGKMATEPRVTELRAELSARPFRGMVIACPYTPNIWKAGPTPDSVLDAYAPWLFDVLLPRLRAETPVFAESDRVGLDGVSLGGYASLGVGVRRLDAIGALGCVQAAVSTPDADRWSARIAKAFATHGPRPLHLLTSTLDVFRAPVEALSRALKQRGVAHTLRIAVGPHDQPFLRGPGSLEMLLWHDRALAGASP